VVVAFCVKGSLPGEARQEIMQPYKQYPLLQKFETHLHEKRFLSDSVRAYCADVRQYLEWLGERGKASPRDADIEDAQDYVTFLADDLHWLRPGRTGTYSPSTVARKVKTLRYFYDFLDRTL